MNELPPQFIILAGPNGAGKSTSARLLLPKEVAFVNADEIAKQLPGAGEKRDLDAGRIALAELDRLESERKSFAIETTLASRTFAKRIQRVQKTGYISQVIYLWIPSAELAVMRVADRVRRGGHHIPEDVIRRRYQAGLRNFLNLYIPVADEWALLDNQYAGKPKLIAQGEKGADPDIREMEVWKLINEQ